MARNTTRKPTAPTAPTAPATTLGAALAQPAAAASVQPAPVAYTTGAKAPRPRTTLAPGQKSETVNAWAVVADYLQENSGAAPLADIGAAVVNQLGVAAAPKKYAPYFVRRGWLVPLGSNLA